MCSRYKTHWRQDCLHYAILSGEGGIVSSNMPLEMKCLLVLEFVIKKISPQNITSIPVQFIFIVVTQLWRLRRQKLCSGALA